MLKIVSCLIFKVPSFSANSNMVKKLSFFMSKAQKLYPEFLEEENKIKEGKDWGKVRRETREKEDKETEYSSILL